MCTCNPISCWLASLAEMVHSMLNMRLCFKKYSGEVIEVGILMSTPRIHVTHKASAQHIHFLHLLPLLHTHSHTHTSQSLCRVQLQKTEKSFHLISFSVLCVIVPSCILM